MPWKLVSFLFVLIVVTLFIGFNLDNRCNVSFIFYTYHDVPIFVSLLFAYAAGAITVVPFLFGFRKKKMKKGPAKYGSSSAKGSLNEGRSRGRPARNRPSYQNDDDSGINPRDYDID